MLHNVDDDTLEANLETLLVVAIEVAHLVTGDHGIVRWLIRVASTGLSYAPLVTFTLEVCKRPALFKGIAISLFLFHSHQYLYQTSLENHYYPPLHLALQSQKVFLEEKLSRPNNQHEFSPPSIWSGKLDTLYQIPRRFHQLTLMQLLATSKGPNPVAEVTILLKQISSKQHQHDVGLGAALTIEWDISICGDDAECVRVVSLLDPSILATEENLRWYLEEFVIKSPFEHSRSHVAAAELKAYAERLIDGLGLQAPLQHLRSKLHLSDETLLTVFLDIEAETASATTSIHSLHWEVLEDMSVWPEQTNHQIIVRRKVPELDIAQSVQPKSNVPGFNILIVVARDLSRGADEISHTLATAGMFKIIGELPSKTPVNLEIVRPGTWDSLKRHLESRPNGYFSLIHLDMHRRVNTRTKKLVNLLSTVSSSYTNKVAQWFTLFRFGP